MAGGIVKQNKVFDLEERTGKYGKEIILFAKSLSVDIVNSPLISQLIRSSTSIGANYMEADCAESKKDFNHKISICKKEAKETQHWLHMVATANSDKVTRCRELWKEARELTLIFSAIIRSGSKRG